LIIQTAVGVTLVGFVESIAVAQLYAQRHGYDISAGSELKALGIANMVR
jgi:SulP family sulfate permease